ncbi:sce7726 family protein [Paraburkholderia nemoris]|uniref:sce7726 family protein n=1 Tax=Paraburkholderia nemoris TaxID=2793076 RepID=UPI0038B86627
MALNATHLVALSRLFSSSVFREMAKKGRSPLFTRLFAQTGLSDRREGEETVGAAFEAAFAVLRRSGLRNEYVYRSALTQNVLLGRHSLQTASMLTEFRAGSCKADVAILNGTSTVYEIKSERDSLARLANQIANYRKVFAKIYVIAGEAHVQEVIDSTPSDVGVMSLVRWDRICTVREAADRSDSVCPVTIFESLRSAEARAILRELEVSVPDVPNTMLHGVMRECFARLDPAEVHRRMVKTLKRTRNLAPLAGLVDRLPASLQPAALSVQLRHSDHERLVEAVRTPLVEAMTWA